MLSVYYGPSSAYDGNHYDGRRLDTPGSIRHAADMLNFDGKVARNHLIDAIYQWCVARTRTGEGYPLEASELAMAYRAFRNACKKIGGS